MESGVTHVGIGYISSDASCCQFGDGFDKDVIWCDAWLGDVFMFEYHCVGYAFRFRLFVVDAVAAVVFFRGA